MAARVPLDPLAVLDLSPSEQREIGALADLSARLGNDPLLVQAGTGNTSVKVGQTLWIKASGKWLADALRQNIFVRVHAGSQSCSGDAAMRPSIETAMHAVLPHKVVIHVHSINTIAWAVRQDGRAQLQPRLEGLRWCWIPHVPSGLPLANEIAAALCRSPGVSVFVLANHGLVVCGRSCDAAETLLRDVERRLAICPRPSASPDGSSLEQFSCDPQWRLPCLTKLHALGTDKMAQTILRGGVLYPCHAIFLAPSFTAVQPGASIAQAIARYQGKNGRRPPFLILQDRGVLIGATITRAEYAMLAGLLEVVQRLEGSALIQYLTKSEVRCLLNADMYRDRTSLETIPAD